MTIDERTTDQIRGALLGTAIGDALGMPVTGFSHQNIRTFYKGIKGYRDDERRGDMKAGQWTDHTQRMQALCRREVVTRVSSHDEFASVRAHAVQDMPLRRDEIPGTSSHIACCVAPLGVIAAVQEWTTDEIIRTVRAVFHHPKISASSLVAGVGQIAAISTVLGRSTSVGSSDFVDRIAVSVQQAEDVLAESRLVSGRLLELSGHLREFPLDLQDRCNGTGFAADEAFPFAIAMFARGPELVESTLLSAINVGGDTSAIGAMVGSLLGALNEWSAFPEEWKRDLEDVEQLLDKVDEFISTLV